MFPIVLQTLVNSLLLQKHELLLIPAKENGAHLLSEPREQRQKITQIIFTNTTQSLQEILDNTRIQITHLPSQQSGK